MPETMTAQMLLGIADQAKKTKDDAQTRIQTAIGGTGVTCPIATDMLLLQQQNGDVLDAVARFMSNGGLAMHITTQMELAVAKVAETIEKKHNSVTLRSGILAIIQKAVDKFPWIVPVLVIVGLFTVIHNPEVIPQLIKAIKEVL